MTMQMMPNANCAQRLPVDVLTPTPAVLDVTTTNLNGECFVYGPALFLYGTVALTAHAVAVKDLAPSGAPEQ
jgi:hypothetical protein